MLYILNCISGSSTSIYQCIVLYFTLKTKNTVNFNANKTNKLNEVHPSNVNSTDLRLLLVVLFHPATMTEKGNVSELEIIENLDASAPTDGNEGRPITPTSLAKAIVAERGFIGKIFFSNMGKCCPKYHHVPRS